MVHRPCYHDWLWPRGRTEHGESPVAVIVREAEEGIGQIITPGAPLTAQHYRLGGGQTKEVHYWMGTPAPAGHASEHLRTPVVRAPCTGIGQTAWTSSERAADMPTCRGDHRLLADIVACAREGHFVTTALFVLHPGQGFTPRLGEIGGARATASSSAPFGSSVAPIEVVVPSKPRPAPAPTMAAPAAARGAARVEQGSTKKVEIVPKPVDLPLNRFDMHQAFDLIDLFSGFGVARVFASLVVRSRQDLTPWVSMGGGSVTLVESLDLTVSGPDAQIDGGTYLGRVRAFAAEYLREYASPTALPVAGTAHDAIIGKIRVYVPVPVADGEASYLKHGQVLVAHVEYAGGPLTVAILETYGVITENPAVRTCKASKKR